MKKGVLAENELTLYQISYERKTMFFYILDHEDLLYKVFS
jgi:hypothetical protein